MMSIPSTNNCSVPVPDEEWDFVMTRIVEQTGFTELFWDADNDIIIQTEHIDDPEEVQAMIDFLEDMDNLTERQQEIVDDILSQFETILEDLQED